MGIGQNPKTQHGIVQRHQVIRRDVIAVTFLNFVRKLPSISFLTEPEQVLRKLNFCREIFGVGSQRPALGGGAFRKTILLRELPAN